jgi:hypothetical protein
LTRPLSADVLAPDALHCISLLNHFTDCAEVVSATTLLLLLMQLMMYDDNRYEFEAKYTQFATLASCPVWPSLPGGGLDVSKFKHLHAHLPPIANSHAAAVAVQLMVYDDNRYEVEAKYTQFITLASRPVWPRLDMTPLAAVLNQLEARYSQQQQPQQQLQPQQQGLWRTNSGSSTPGSATRVPTQQQQQQQQGGGVVKAGAPPAAAGSLRWVANSLTDTGRRRERVQQGGVS